MSPRISLWALGWAVSFITNPKDLDFLDYAPSSCQVLESRVTGEVPAVEINFGDYVVSQALLAGSGAAKILLGASPQGSIHGLSAGFEAYKLHSMEITRLVFTSLAFLSLSLPSSGADDVQFVRRAVEKSTLNQPGTKPFHLKATVAPSFERDKGSNRNGEVEIWWVSPTEWRRDVRCSGFHQVAIANGGKEWQKNEGDYFPDWLRNIAVVLVEPVPHVDDVLQKIRSADTTTIQGRKHFSWVTMASNGTVQKGIGAGLYVAQNGLLESSSTLGSSAWLREFKDFHGRKAPTKIDAGSPQVTATVLTLEDLGSVPADFFVAPPEPNSDLIRTEIVSEIDLRKNLISGEPVEWPSAKDGPLQGLLCGEIVVDRTGNVRDVGSVLSDNPALSETASKAIWAFHFKPYAVNGQPVQAISTITMAFKTARPPGTESFEAAAAYFERGRKTDFPAAAEKPTPYVLRASFQARTKAGDVEKGAYVDTFKNVEEWRREATIGKSRFVRAQHGEKRYMLAEGPDAPLLRLVLTILEPIPALDTFVESDWRIKRDTLASVPTIRVASGHESEKGEPDPEHFRGYWFDEAGNLIKTYSTSLETRRADFVEFSGVNVARKIQAFNAGKLALLLQVDELSPLGPISDKDFELKGHEWKRQFTAEVR